MIFIIELRIICITMYIIVLDNQIRFNAFQTHEIQSLVTLFLTFLRLIQITFSTFVCFSNNTSVFHNIISFSHIRILDKTKLLIFILQTCICTEVCTSTPKKYTLAAGIFQFVLKYIHFERLSHENIFRNSNTDFAPQKTLSFSIKRAQ